MVTFLSGEYPESILKIILDAEDVYMGPEKLLEKYCGYLSIYNDNPFPWRHGPHGYLNPEELNPALYRKIIGCLRKKFSDMVPQSYPDAVRRLTGVSVPPQEFETRNTCFDSVMAKKFPGRTEDEVVALYMVDAMKLRDRCDAVIRKLEQLIKES